MSADVLIKRYLALDYSSKQEVLDIKQEMLDYLRGDHPEAEKQKLAPFGWLESVEMVLDGFDYK